MEDPRNGADVIDMRTRLRVLLNTPGPGVGEPVSRTDELLAVLAEIGLSLVIEQRRLLAVLERKVR